MEVRSRTSGGRKTQMFRTPVLCTSALDSAGPSPDSHCFVSNTSRTGFGKVFMTKGSVFVNHLYYTCIRIAC